MKRTIICGGLIIVFFLIGVFFFLNSEDGDKIIDSVQDKFEDKTKKDKEANLTLMGDILFEAPFYKSYENGYDINDYFSLIKDKLTKDDLSIANLEVVIGNDSLEVSGDGYNFCAPEYIGDLISSLDFEVLGTANNHTMDRGLDGVYSTIDYFKDSDIKTVGTYKTEEEKKEGLVLDINGIKFGFLAYTYGTNQKIPSDATNLIGLYRNNVTKVFDEESKKVIEEEVNNLKTKSDVLVVMMHWGNEFTYDPTNEQKEVANFLNSLGVDIIYGSHSHCMQPIEVIGDEHKTVVYYSLGNFVSNDDDIARTPLGQETFDNAYQVSLLSTLKVKMDDENNITISDIKTEPIINYFDEYLNNWLLIPYDNYSIEYEKSHNRYNKGLNKEFIDEMYKKVIPEDYR